MPASLVGHVLPARSLLGPWPARGLPRRARSVYLIGALVAGGLALAIGACGTDTTDHDQAPDTADAPAPDTVVAGDSAGGPSGDTGDDAAEPTTFGARCERNEDCASGWCIPSAFGGDERICTGACAGVEPCPAGWSCAEVTSAGVDPVYLCLPSPDACELPNICGDCSPYCRTASAGRDTDEPFHLAAEWSEALELDEDGALVLEVGEIAIPLKNLWVANSSDDTVSRISTVSGLETGRYRVCDDPSRSAVDLQGDAYIACRGDDRVVKIIADSKRCPDRNANHRIDTAADLDGDGQVTGDEVLPLGEDECVAWITSPLGGDRNAIARGMAIDRKNVPWVGYSKRVTGLGYTVMSLDPATGAVTRTISDLPGDTYGMALDQRGRLWIAGPTEGLLTRVDIEQDPAPVVSYTPPDVCQLYGIGVDHAGKVWLTNSSCDFVYRFDSDAESFDTFEVPVGLGWLRGVAADRFGRVLVAHHRWSCQAGSSVTVLDAVSGAVLGSHLMAEEGVAGPVGVAFDSEGDAWAVNQCAGNVVKLDPDTGEVLLTRPVGSGPYTYSDMTGYNLRAFVAPSGTIRHVVAGWPQFETKWQRIDVDALLGPGAYLNVRVRAADSPGELASVPWSEFIGPYPPAQFPVALEHVPNLDGGFLEVELWLFAGPSEAAFPSVVERVDVQFTRRFDP